MEKRRKIFVDTYKQHPSQLDQIFNIQDSDMATEKLSQVGAFPGVSELTGKIEYSESPVQGLTKVIALVKDGYMLEVPKTLHTDKVKIGGILQWIISRKDLLMKNFGGLSDSSMVRGG